MNYFSKINFINQFCICKEDILDMLGKYIEHCKETTEENWSENKRRVILELLYKFRGQIRNTSFPKIQGTDWYYEYRWLSDGIVLELLYCEEAEFEEDGEISSLKSSNAITLVEVKCNYLTVEEYAQKYEVTVTAVRQWIRRGKLRSAKKIGRDWIIPELADKPQRGYEPVTYSWGILSEDIVRNFPFLKDANAVNILQDTSDKSKYIISLIGKTKSCYERIHLSINEREKLEVALISEPEIQCEEWYRNVIFVPQKRRNYRIFGKRIWEEEKISMYMDKINLLKEYNLEISTCNWFHDEDGMYVWGISAHLDKYLTEELQEEIDDDSQMVVKLQRGIIIPSESEFGDEDGYVTARELCDAISADMISTYDAIADCGEGIKPEIIKELGMTEDDAYESSILYIEDIYALTPEYLRLFLEIFDIVIEGLPAQYCKLAVVLMNWEKENEKAKIFLECGWKIRNIDASCIVAYRKL